MTIKEELATELRDAMKRGDSKRKDVIRIIDTEVKLASTASGFRGQVDDNLYRQVIATYSKKMDKARLEYEGLGERAAPMAEKLAWEVEYLSRWLPSKLGEAATSELVSKTIVELGVGGQPKAAGRVIGAIMKDHKDAVDGSLVNRLVAAALAGGE